MSHKYIAAVTLIVLVAAQACTGYRDMKNEIKAYQPPSYLPAQEWPGTDQAESQIDTGFKAEKKQMAETRERWERALTQLMRKRSFFAPSQQSWRRCGRPVATTAQRPLPCNPGSPRKPWKR